MAVIITHTSPDWDAICAVWLLQRYGSLAGAQVARGWAKQGEQFGRASAFVLMWLQGRMAFWLP